MLKLGSVLVLVLAGWAALEPRPMSWVFIAAVAAFELWLAQRMAALDAAPVVVDEPPYRFSAEEAALVARYRFYFTYPASAAQAGSVLAAIGLSSAVLALWLTFRQAPVEGALIGLNLFGVGWLELSDSLWLKIRYANEQAAGDQAAKGG